MSDSEQYELASWCFNVGASILAMTGVAMSSFAIMCVACVVFALSWWLQHLRIKSMEVEYKARKENHEC